jgi:hypothetical protein
MVKITKVGLARAAAGAYIILDYHREMEENYRKGDWLEAAKDTGFFAVKMLPVVAPAFVFGAMAPYWIGAAVGVGATMAIVEITGIGEWEDVRDLVLDPDPVEWYKVVAPELEKKYRDYEQKTEEWSVAAAGWIDRRLMDVQHSLEREYQEKKTLLQGGWDLLNRYGRWANPTPGVPWL